ncbi:hypothetical protein Gotur_006201, partial [Gossypium turneri]
QVVCRIGTGSLSAIFWHDSLVFWFRFFFGVIGQISLRALHSISFLCFDWHCVVVGMEDALENLRLLDDEEEALQEHDGASGCDHQLCLVGRCLTDSVVHFPSLHNTMADLWHPIGGICITEIGEKRYLFQFFHELDIERVVAGIPWFFNNHLIILQRVPIGVNPVVMELNHTEFWIQVHDLPPGLMSVSMAKQLGDF